MVRKAFTMIELIFVIVVMGILASIGTDIITQMYKNYLFTRSVNTLEQTTQTALSQITNLLQYRIKDSTIARQSTNFNTYDFTREVSPLVDYDMIEWIGYSNKSLDNVGNTPGWSGFIDVDSNDTTSAGKTISTPGSNLGQVSEILTRLTYNSVSFNAAGATNKPAIVFKGVSHGNKNGFGWNGIANDANYTIRVSRKDDTTFSIEETTLPSTITEQYYLAHTAYAIVPVQTGAIRGNNIFNLELHYNYRPWEGQRYDRNGNTALLARNVSLFRFKEQDGMLIVKLCMADNSRSIDSNETDFRVCKEKVIY